MQIVSIEVDPESPTRTSQNGEKLRSGRQPCSHSKHAVMERSKHRKAMITGDRQSTHKRPGSGRHVEDASIKKQKHVKRAYSKLKQRLGEVKTYDLDALEDLDAVDPMPSISGDQVDVTTTGPLRDGKAGASPSGDVKQRRGAPKRNRTKEKKAFFKKTRSGQPVMSSRINKLLEDIRSR